MSDKRFEIINGDCINVLKQYEDNYFDSIVTDPPYGISFMNKKWDYDVPSIEVWQECLRVLKPGGHLLSFGGARTFHRIAIKIEDAGFELRDTIMWVYGSGFPKSLDVGKAVDKLQGNERVTLGINPSIRPNHGNNPNLVAMTQIKGKQENLILTKGNSIFEGWGTALKPAFEPIILARKPFKNSVAKNVLEYGTGAINIDGCRVGDEDMSAQWDRVWNENNGDMGKRYSQNSRERGKNVPPGRWPANFIHDGSEDVLNIFPDNVEGKDKFKKSASSIYGSKTNLNEYNGESTSQWGSAARFFYCTKASNRDRDEGLEGFALGNNMRVNGPRESEEAKHATLRANTHPTVKPTNLMRYLCRLITPPGGLVLDPYNGSGSTGKAAIMEGFNYIGIEREEEYCKISTARINHALDKLSNNAVSENIAKFFNMDKKEN
ncbi:hypothetical protein [Microcystis phage Mel-JY01]